ncbi:MAG TPA: hypothetical protein VG388_09830 [Solirubrobacteraceae bacterium]|jgi:hypothetical protein|nr:hypothetical protein [Solirubrobacteraceae bacterium]
MSKRGRFITYGSALALVLAGIVCAAVVSGVAGQVLAIVLIGSGLVILTGLIFMEVGLSEDRDREREARGAVAQSPRRRLEPARMPRLRGPRHQR